jgi:DNA-binding MarR family transcriptional regulator
MMGVSQASVSRAIAALGELHRLGKPGYNLVETHEDPEERRRKIVFLSKKGIDVMTKVVRNVRPGEVIPSFPALTYKEHMNKLHRAHAR